MKRILTAMLALLALGLLVPMQARAGEVVFDHIEKWQARALNSMNPDNPWAAASPCIEHAFFMPPGRWVYEDTRTMEPFQNNYYSGGSAPPFLMTGPGAMGTYLDGVRYFGGEVFRDGVLCANDDSACTHPEVGHVYTWHGYFETSETFGGGDYVFRQCPAIWGGGTSLTQYGIITRWSLVRHPGGEAGSSANPHGTTASQKTSATVQGDAPCGGAAGFVGNWSVAAYVTADTAGAPHPVPWSFAADGSVRAGDLWAGTWQYRGGCSADMTIRVGEATDSFRIEFIDGQHFRAVQNGQNYRYATRLR